MIFCHIIELFVVLQFVFKEQDERITKDANIKEKWNSRYAQTERNKTSEYSLIICAFSTTLLFAKSVEQVHPVYIPQIPSRIVLEVT